MKLHLPLGLLVAVLVSLQANADVKTFDLTYKPNSKTSWVWDEDISLYECRLPFSLYGRGEAEWWDVVGGGHWHINISLNRSETPTGSLSTIPTSIDVDMYAADFLLKWTSSSLQFKGFAYAPPSSEWQSARVTVYNTGIYSHIDFDVTGGSIPNSGMTDSAVNSPTPNLRVKWDARGGPIRYLYASTNKLDIEVHATLRLESTDEYAVAVSGRALGASYRRGSGLLQIYDDFNQDPRNRTSLPILNMDKGIDADTLFLSDPSDGHRNTLRFVSSPKDNRRYNIRAIEDSNEDFHRLPDGVGDGGEVFTGGDFYAGGLKVDTGAWNYSLVVDGNATFGKTPNDPADFVFNEDFILNGSGTVNWDCSEVHFTIAEGKTVTWNMAGSETTEKNPEVFLYWRDVETDVLTVGGTLQLGNNSNNAFGKGDISICGMTLDVNNLELENEHITLYSIAKSNDDGTVTKHGSNLKNAGNLASNVQVQINNKLNTQRPGIPQEDEMTGGNFDLGGLKAENLTYVDLHLGGRVTGLKAGTTLNVKDENSFQFLVDAANVTTADERDAKPHAADAKNEGKYLVKFDDGEKGKIDFGGTASDAKVKLYFTVDAVRKILGIKKDENGNNIYDTRNGYVDIWFTNGTMPYEELSAKPGDLAAIKEWFDRHFDLPNGVEAFNGWGDIDDGKTWGGWVTDEDGKLLGDMNGTGDEDERFQFENELWEMYYETDAMGHVIYDTYIPGEDGGGIIRVFLSVDGIYMAGAHGANANAGRLNDSRWSQVWVDTDLTANFTLADYVELGNSFTLRNLSSGDAQHGGNLRVNVGNDLKELPLKEGLELVIDQQVDEYGDPVAAYSALNGSIIFDPDIPFDLTKKGEADLTVVGNVENADVLKVSEGKLKINGSVEAVELSVEGEQNTDGIDNVLVLNGFGNTADRLTEVGAGAELVINGGLTLSGNSELNGANGGGTICGLGGIWTEGNFDASKVKLDGIAVGIGKEGSLITSGGSRISALCSETTGNAKVELNGDLTIDSTADITIAGDAGDNKSSFYKGAGACYVGAISAAENATITISGEQTMQAFWSNGDDSINILVTGKARAELLGAAQASTDPAEPLRPPSATYGDVTIAKDSTLRVSAPTAGKYEPVTTHLETKTLTVEEGGTLELFYNLKPTDGNVNPQGTSEDDPQYVGSSVKTGTLNWLGKATLRLGSLDVNPLNIMNPEDLRDFVLLEADNGGLDKFIDSDSDSSNDKVLLDLAGSFKIFWENAELSTKDDGKSIVVNATAKKGNILAQMVDKEENPQAAARLLWAARGSDDANTAGTELQKLIMYIIADSGNQAALSKVFTAVAGGTVPIAGSAQRDALRSQVIRMRDHASAMGLDSSASYQSLPFTHFWVEASGDFINLNDDEYRSGYKYNAWGGTIGMEMDISEKTSFGAGLTVLYGDLEGGCTDTADGSLDSYYLTLMAHVSRHRWGHTLIGVLGLNNADLDRTVQYDASTYKTSGSTEGWGTGFMYELTYDIPLNESHTHILQPLVAASILHTTLNGYNENRVQGVGLDVGEQEWTTSTVSVGLRWISTLGASVFNTSAQLEMRAAIAQDIGDSQGEANVGLQANPGVRQTIKSAEVGKTGAQFGAALRMPISENTMLFFNVGADLRSGMNSWNVTAGAKYSF